MEIQAKLTRLGFSEKESLVYLALLELGKSTVSRIARRARINRTTAYDIITELEHRGLAVKAVSAKTKKQLYAPEPPEKLILYLERREKEWRQGISEAQTLMGELKFLAQKQPGPPRLKLFEGKAGIKELYETSLTAKEEIRSFNSVESLEQFDKSYAREYFQRRAAKNIFIKAIVNDGPLSHEYKKRDNREKREIRIVPQDKMDIGPEIYFYDNSVSIFSLKENFGVMIESREITEAFKKLYDLAWERAKAYEL